MTDTLPLITIPGLTTQAELEALYAWAKEATAPGAIVELGTFRGRATAALCYAVGDNRIISVDTYQMQHHGEAGLDMARKNLRQCGFAPSLYAVSSTDKRLFAFLEIATEVSIALLFIDTDHRRAHLEQELDLWLPYLAQGGILALHDTDNPRWPDVAAVASERLSAWEEVGRIPSDGQSGGIAAWRKP